MALKIVHLLGCAISKVPSEAYTHLSAEVVPGVELENVDLSKEVFLTNLGLFFYKYVVEDFNETLHCLLKGQLTIGSKKLQVKVPFCNLFLLKNTTFISQYFDHFFFLFDI